MTGIKVTLTDGTTIDSPTGSEQEIREAARQVDPAVDNAQYVTLPNGDVEFRLQAAHKG